MNRLSLLVAGAFFMEFLDGSIITTALPAMAHSLGTNPVDLNPGISAYLITVAVFILPSGWLAERFGGRVVFTGAILVFTAASVLCACATSADMFIATRVLQGIGGAMMVPVGRLLVLRTTAKANLMRAIAVLTWPALTAPLLGPPLGGFVAEHASWRWIFLVNLPLGLAGALLSLRIVPSAAGDAHVPFDWPGFALAAGACVFGMYGLELLGRGDASAWQLVAPLALAAALAAGLVRHVGGRRGTLIDPSVLRVATFRATLVGGTLARTLVSAVPFLLPLMFQLGFGLDSFRAGLLVLALFAGNLGIKPLTSRIIRVFGFRTVLAANAFLQAATMLGCAALGPDTATALIAALLVLSGASRSLQFTALNTLAFADVPQPQMAGANMLFSVSFQVSLGLGVTLGAILLRGAALMRGAEAPSLPEFQAAFVGLAALMAAVGLLHLGLRRDAGLAVSRPSRG